MKTCFAAILALAACIVPAPGQAQEKDDRVTMNTVVVTADRAEEKLRDVPQNVTIIGREEIELSPADNIVGLLKRHGIQTSWSGSANYGGEGIVMRGGKSSMHGFDLAGDVLVLVDGRRVGSDNFSIMGLNNVDRIEIIRGPGSVQYGSGAIGGVINIITKRGQEKPEINLEAGGGSYNMQRYKGFASGRFEQLDMVAWGSYATGNNYKDGDGNKLANTGMDHLAKFGFNVGWNFNEKNRLGISFNGADGRGMEMGPAVETNYKNQYQDRDYYLAEILYEGATTDDSLSWMARYYFGRTGYKLNRESNRAASLGDRDWYSNNKNEIQGGQAQLTFAGPDRFKLTGGMDVLYYDMNQNQVYGLHNTLTSASYTDSDYLNIGGVLLGKLYLLENWDLVFSAGGRYDYFKVNTDTDYAPGTASYRNLNNDSSVKNFTPSFGVAYTPIDFLKLRANYSHAFRMPTPRQLGGVFGMGMNTFYGNPDLDPERSRTWDVGFDVMYKALNASFSYFNTRYKDMIDAPAVAGSRERHYTNLDRAYVDGIEASLRYDIGQQLDWPVRLEPYVSLTHLCTFRDDSGNDISSVARNTVSWGLNFDYLKIGLASSLDFTYYDKRVSDALDGGATVVDFSLSQRIVEFEGGGDLKLKLAVLNLFDKYYATSGNDYMPGRTFYAGLSYTF